MSWVARGFRQHMVRRSIERLSRLSSVLRHVVALYPTVGIEELLAYHRILILAPHPDDESFAMGGTLLLLGRRGVQRRVVWFTNGSNQTRTTEAMRALDTMGIAQSDRDGFPLDHLHVLEHEACTICEREIHSYRPDLICVPSVFEFHEDHVRVLFGLRKAIQMLAPRCTVLQYEVWNSLAPNLLVDISEVVEDKRLLMENYQSQVAGGGYSYISRILGLNHYRGITAGVGHAEAFILTTAPEFLRVTGQSQPK